MRARWALVALPLSCAIAWGQSTGSASSAARAAARRCHSPHASVDACDDAIRWNPQDSSLLAAMGDAQLRAKHPADAARAYRRAAALAPSTPGIQQKISEADALLAKAKTKTKTKAKTPPATAATATAAASTAAASTAAASTAAAKRFSNADPETQSH